MPESAAGTKRTEDSPSLKPVKAESLTLKVNSMFDSIARRAFEIFEDSGHTLGHDLADWFKAESELLHPVHLNVNETDDSVNVQAEVPGFTEKDLQISVEPHRVTITGKRESKSEQKKGKAFYTEACSDQIMRVVELPSEVDTEKATATIKNGVLEVTAPKVAKARNISIQPKSAA